MAPKTFLLLTNFVPIVLPLQALVFFYTHTCIYFLFILHFRRMQKASWNEQRNCLGSGINYPA